MQLNSIEMSVLMKAQMIGNILTSLTAQEKEAIDSLQAQDLVLVQRGTYGSITRVIGLTPTDLGMTITGTISSGHWEDFVASDAVARTGSSAGPLDMDFARDLNFIFSYEDTRDADTIYLVPPINLETRQRLLDTLRKWSIEFGETERRGRTFYAVPYITHTS